MSQELAAHVPAETVAEVLQRIEDSWRALLAALDDVPEDRLEDPSAVGEWSIKHLYGHIAFWDELISDKVAAALAGQPISYANWQELNEADHASRLGRSLSEERAVMHQAHAALIASLESLEGLPGAQIDDVVKGSTYEHYDEHVVDLRDWLARTS